jgi:hypothetical protein
MKHRSLLLRLHNESSLEADATNSFDVVVGQSSVDETLWSPEYAKSAPIVDCGDMEVNIHSSLSNDDDGSSALTTDMTDEWSLGDYDASTDFYSSIPPLKAEHLPNSLYSFYFEATYTTMAEDDASLTLDGDVSFGGADSLLDGHDEVTSVGNAATTWPTGTPMVVAYEQRLSPAQVSLASIDFDDL